MKDPSRDLPRVVHFGMPTVLCCYILINMAYYVVIPWDELSASNAIAVVRSIFFVDEIFSYSADKLVRRRWSARRPWGLSQGSSLQSWFPFPSSGF